MFCFDYLRPNFCSRMMARIDQNMHNERQKEQYIFVNKYKQQNSKVYFTVILPGSKKHFQNEIFFSFVRVSNLIRTLFVIFICERINRTAMALLRVPNGV